MAVEKEGLIPAQDAMTAGAVAPQSVDVMKTGWSAPKASVPPATIPPEEVSPAPVVPVSGVPQDFGIDDYEVSSPVLSDEAIPQMDPAVDFEVLNNAERREEESRAANVGTFATYEGISARVSALSRQEELTDEDYRQLAVSASSMYGYHPDLLSEESYLRDFFGEKDIIGAGKRVFEQFKARNEQDEGRQVLWDDLDPEDRVLRANKIFYGNDEASYKPSFGREELERAKQIDTMRGGLLDFITRGASNDVVTAGLLLGSEGLGEDRYKDILDTLSEEEQAQAMIIGNALRTENNDVLAWQALQVFGQSSVNIAKNIGLVLGSSYAGQDVFAAVNTLSRDSGKTPEEFLKTADQASLDKIRLESGDYGSQEGLLSSYKRYESYWKKNRRDVLVSDLDRIKPAERGYLGSGVLAAAESLPYMGVAVGAVLASKVTFGASLSLLAPLAAAYAGEAKSTILREGWTDLTAAEEIAYLSVVGIGSAAIDRFGAGLLVKPAARALVGGVVGGKIGRALVGKTAAQTLAGAQSRTVLSRIAHVALSNSKRLALLSVGEGVEEGLQAALQSGGGVLLDPLSPEGKKLYGIERFANDVISQAWEGFKAAPFLLAPFHSVANVQEAFGRSFVDKETGVRKSLFQADQEMINARARLDAIADARREGLDVAEVEVFLSKDEAGRREFILTLENEDQVIALERLIEYDDYVNAEARMAEAKTAPAASDDEIDAELADEAERQMDGVDFEEQAFVPAKEISDELVAEFPDLEGAVLSGDPALARSVVQSALVENSERLDELERDAESLTAGESLELSQRKGFDRQLRRMGAGIVATEAETPAPKRAKKERVPLRPEMRKANIVKKMTRELGKDATPEQRQKWLRDNKQVVKNEFLKKKDEVAQLDDESFSLEEYERIDAETTALEEAYDGLLFDEGVREFAARAEASKARIYALFGDGYEDLSAWIVENEDAYPWLAGTFERADAILVELSQNPDENVNIVPEIRDAVGAFRDYVNALKEDPSLSVEAWLSEAGIDYGDVGVVDTDVVDSLVKVFDYSMRSGTNAFAPVVAEVSLEARISDAGAGSFRTWAERFGDKESIVSRALLDLIKLRGEPEVLETVIEEAASPVPSVEEAEPSYDEVQEEEKISERVQEVEEEEIAQEVNAERVSAPSLSDVEAEDESAPTPKEKFVSAVEAKLGVEKMTVTTLRKMRTAAGLDVDDIVMQELVELAIVKKARSEVARLQSSGASVTETFRAVVDLYNAQPALSVRSSNKIALQQYSTPIPLSFMADMFVGATDPKLVLEPSAGNGMMVFALPQKNVHVNDIDAVRRGNLEGQGFAKVTGQDALLPFDGVYDGVVTNPPFGKSDAVGFDGYKVSGLERKMALNALASMRDSGRAAIIIGGNTEYAKNGTLKRADEKAFFNYLYSHYNVVDVMNVDGKLYHKQGTTYPVRLILIDGRKESPDGSFAPIVSEANAETVSDWDAVAERVNSHISKPQVAEEALPAPVIERAPINPNAEKVAYPTQSRVPQIGSVIPRNMYEGVSENLSKFDDVDAFVAEKLGYEKKELSKYFSAEQIDGVALAIRQLETKRANGKNFGFINGDMTGVGKGRQAAAIIRYAVKSGVRPIFFTEKAGLFSDLYRDLADISSGELKPFILNATSDSDMTNAEGKVIHKRPPSSVLKTAVENKSIPSGYDYVVTTYSQINSKTRPKRGLISRLAEDSIVIMDESHNASGDSNTGAFLMDVATNARGVSFFSGTFAKRPDNLPIYAAVTNMSAAKLSAEEFVEAIKAGGVPLQEIMSKNLIESGQMIRRERDYTGVTIDWIPMESNAKQTREAYDKLIEVFNDIIDFQERYVSPVIDSISDDLARSQGMANTRKGTKQMGVTNTPFASKTFNVVRQLLFALKADWVADRAIEQSRAGLKPVIAVANTMEGVVTEEMNLGDVVESSDFSATAVRGLNGVLRYTEKDAAGEESLRVLEPEDLGQLGFAQYNKILKRIRETYSGIPLSPIDRIKNKLRAAGIRVAEMTGRKTELIEREDGKLELVKRADTDKKKNARDFNNGDVDVLIINQSASTGISLHASNKFKDQRKRVMIFAQNQLDVNTEVQMRGRTDRTGQVERSAYEYPVSDIPAEGRLMMMFKHKLKSLDANTTSSQKSKLNEIDVVDFQNEYGDEIVYEYVNVERPELLYLLREKEDTAAVSMQGEEENVRHEGYASRILGRVALLPTDEQETFYRDVSEKYTALIDYLNETGQNKLEIKVVPLRAETKSREVIDGREDSKETNPFAGPVYLEDVEVDVLKKPMTSAQILKEVDILSEGLSGEEYAKRIENKLAEQNKRFSEISMKRTASDLEFIAETKRKEKPYLESSEEKRKELEAGFSKHKEELVKSKGEAALRIEEMRTAPITNANNEFVVGNTYVVPFSDSRGIADTSSQPQGIFVGFVLPKSGAKILPSSVKARFATLDGRRMVNIPISQFEDISRIVRATSMVKYGNKSLVRLDEWDSQIPTNSRESVKMMTGNLLLALKDNNNGSLVEYTTIDGSSRYGVLMPKGFNRENLRVTVPISDQMEAIKDGARVTSVGMDVTVYKESRGYVLAVPKSKVRGAKYFSDEELLKLVKGGNFFSFGGGMVGTFEESALPGILARLSGELGVRVPVKVGEGGLRQSRGGKNMLKELDKRDQARVAEVVSKWLPNVVKKISILSDEEFNTKLYERSGEDGKYQRGDRPVPVDVGEKPKALKTIKAFDAYASKIGARPDKAFDGLLVRDGDKEARKKWFSDKLNPKREITAENYFESTETTFVPLERFEEQEDAEARFKQMQDKGGFEHHVSPKSASSYLIDKNTGDVYRLSDHWGQVASCLWHLKGGWSRYDNGGKPWTIAKSNLKDFESLYIRGYELKEEMVSSLVAAIKETEQRLNEILSDEAIQKSDVVKTRIDDILRQNSDLLFRVLDLADAPAYRGRRFLYDDERRVYGFYDANTGDVVVRENARVDTLLHEIGGHATWLWAHKNAPEMAKKLQEYAKNVPADIAEEVARFYPEFHKGSMEYAEELFATAFGYEHAGKIDVLLESEASKTWWDRVKALFVRAWKKMLSAFKKEGNAVDVDMLTELGYEDAIESLAQSLIEGRSLSHAELRQEDYARTESDRKRMRFQKEESRRDYQSRTLHEAAKRAMPPTGVRLEAQGYQEYIEQGAVLIAAKMLQRGAKINDYNDKADAQDNSTKYAGALFPGEDGYVLADMVNTARALAAPMIAQRAARAANIISTVDAIREARQSLSEAKRRTRNAFQAYANINIDPRIYARADAWRKKRKELSETGALKGTRALSKTELRALGVPPLEVALNADTWVDNVKEALTRRYEGKGSLSQLEMLGVLRKTLYGQLRDATRSNGNSGAVVRAHRVIDEMLYKAKGVEVVVKRAKEAAMILKEGAVKTNVFELRERIYKTLSRFSRVKIRDVEKNRKTAGLTEKFLNYAYRSFRGEFGTDGASISRSIAALNNVLNTDSRSVDDPSRLDDIQRLEAMMLMSHYIAAVGEVRDGATPTLEENAETARSLANVANVIEARIESGDVDLERRLGRLTEEANKSAEKLAKAIEQSKFDKSNRKTAMGNVRENLISTFTGTLSIEQQLKDAIRFCTDPQLRADAEAVIDKINTQIGTAEAKTRELEFEGRKWLAEELCNRFNAGKYDPAESTRILAWLARPNDNFKRFSRDKNRPLSAANVLAQIAMVRQKEVRDAFLNLTQEELSAELEDPAKLSLYNRIQSLPEMESSIREEFEEKGEAVLGVVDAISAHYLDSAPAIDETAMKIAGIPLTMRTPDYFPIVRDFQKMMLNKSAKGELSYIPAIMTPRVETRMDIDELADVFSVFIRRNTDVSHFLAFGELHMDLSRLLANEKFGVAMEKTQGRAAKSQFIDHIKDVLAPKMDGDEIYGESPAIALLTNLVANAALGANLLVMIRQVTSLPAYALKTGWQKMFRSMFGKKDYGSMLDAMKEIADSAQWESRYGNKGIGASGVDEMRIQLSVLGNKGARRLPRAIAGWLMAPNKWGDRVPILFQGQAIYRTTVGDLLSSINPETKKIYTLDEAKKTAMAVVWDYTEKTQQTGRASNMAVWQRKGGAVGKMIGQFQSTVSQFLSAEVLAVREAAARKDARSLQQLLGVLLNNHIVLPGLFWMATVAWSWGVMGEDPDEDDLWSLVWAMAIGPLTSWYLFGSIFSGSVLQGDFRNASVPATSAAWRAGSGIRKLFLSAKHAATGDFDEAGDSVLKGSLDLLKIYPPIRDAFKFSKQFED